MKISYLFFGKRCASCQKLVSVFSKDYFCDECKKTLEFYEESRSLFFDGSPLIALAPYQNAWRRAILNFKFKNGYSFAPLLASEISKNLDLTGISGILFVPAILKKGRIYNQSEVLAREVAKRLGLPVYKYLRKKKDIKSQTACKNPFERMRNADGAYVVYRKHKKDVKGKSFLLIDDIVTTGATLHSCKKALCDVGARDVSFAVLGKREKGRGKFRLTFTNSEGEKTPLRFKKPKNFEKYAKRQLKGKRRWQIKLM